MGAALNLVGVGLFAIVLVVLFLVELPLVKSDDVAAGSFRSARRLRHDCWCDASWVSTGMFGACIAVIDLVIMWSVGTDAAVLWAVIAFLFAFVPFGFILSAIPPFILTAAGVRRRAVALIMFGLFFVVNFIGDNVVKPKLMGSGPRHSRRWSSSWRCSAGASSWDRWAPCSRFHSRSRSRSCYPILIG